MTHSPTLDSTGLGAAGHGRGHHPRLAHHFDSMAQQQSAAKLGMWLFLVTEILLFGGLFVAYAVYRSLHPEIFHDASHFLNVWLGATNTMVLIGSSLSMALAVRAAQLSRQRALFVNLSITLALAGMFLVIKYFEYTHKFDEGLFPGRWYAPHGAALAAGELPERVRTFFSIYYLMTGLHGVHVLLGMVVISWLLWRAARRHFDASYYTPVECTGLYWHLVDLIWIYLFPLFYLIR
jgi:cytochrome c oxidase subunit 3